MSLIVLSFKIQDSVKPKLSKATLSKAAKTALRFSAEYWREKIMPERFQPGVQTRYSFETRTEFYLRRLKRIFGQGAGKIALLQLRGKSFRAAQHQSSITATQYSATITMRMPSYFTDPKIGVVYENNQRKNIKHQPDKVRELLQTTAANIKQIDQRATELYMAHFQRSPAGSWAALGESLDNQTITMVIS